MSIGYQYGYATHILPVAAFRRLACSILIGAFYASPALADGMQPVPLQAAPQTILSLLSSLWGEHEGFAILLFAILLAQSLAIAAMLTGRQRRRRAERALLARENHYRAIVETANDAIVSADATGAILGCNAAAERMFGYAEAEVRGRPLASLFPGTFPADLPHGSGSVGERTGRRKEGTEFPAELSLAYRKTDKGGIYVCIVRDIGEQKRQAEQVRRLLAEKEAMLRNVPVGIAHAWERRIVSYNRRCEELFGYGSDELVGASIDKVFAIREMAESVGEQAERALDEGTGYSTEVLFRRKDGTQFWGTLNGGAIDPEHPRDGSIWICSDISARRTAEQNANKLQQAVEQSPVSIIITNHDGDIEYVNPRFTEVTGYSFDEVVGQKPRILQSGETPAEVYRELWRTILQGKVWRGVLRNKRSNGELFWEEASISPIFDKAGRITHFVAVKEDITERKRIEQQLENQQQYLEEQVMKRTAELTEALDAAMLADQAKDEFLANVSHELRTPLNVVIGLSELARGMNQDPKQRDYLEKVAEAGKHLSGIINDLLDLSKIAAGRMELEMTAFSLRQLVQRCNSSLAYKAAEKGLRLVEHIDDQVPDALLGDPLRLQQILLNLLSNAIKFTHAGRVEVRIGLAERNGGRVCLRIEVEDSGVGIQEADLKQLFKPFSQIDASMTRKYGGTGLGLAICRRLTELMDGDIAVTSRVGSGTTFTVKIWLGLGQQPETRPAAKGEEAFTHYRNTHVLVVEDQPLNREIVEQLLLAVGIVPRTANNGREALDILAESGPTRFNLILMDIQMPEMDGLTATREIRTRLGFTEVPIIAMTAHAMDHEKRNSLAAGMNDHIGKPFETEDFYRILAKWLPRIKMLDTPASPPSADAGLPALDGIDIRAGLARFAGNQTRYRHWLATFVDEAPGYAAQIRAALADDQTEQARKVVHAVKGRVGMLGMKHLAAIATALEAELKRGKPADDMLDRLQSAIREMCGKLRDAFRAAEDPACASERRNHGLEHES